MMVMLCYAIMGWIILYTGYRIISLCVAEKHISLLFVLPQTNRQTDKQTDRQTVSQSVGRQSEVAREKETDGQTIKLTEGQRGK